MLGYLGLKGGIMYGTESAVRVGVESEISGDPTTQARHNILRCTSNIK